MGITKHNFLVQSAHEIPRAVAAAFYLATTGRPGPVLDRPAQGHRPVDDGVVVPRGVEELDLPGYRPEVDARRAATSRGRPA